VRLSDGRATWFETRGVAALLTMRSDSSSASRAALRMALGIETAVLLLGDGQHLVEQQVWLKPIEQCGGTSVAPVFSL
jgi:hypothetical protein